MQRHSDFYKQHLLFQICKVVVRILWVLWTLINTEKVISSNNTYFILQSEVTDSQVTFNLTTNNTCIYLI